MRRRRSIDIEGWKKAAGHFSDDTWDRRFDWDGYLLRGVVENFGENKAVYLSR